MLLLNVLPLLALTSYVDALALKIPLVKRQDTDRIIGPTNDPLVVDWNALRERRGAAERKFGNGKADRLMRSAGGRVKDVVSKVDEVLEGVNGKGNGNGGGKAALESRQLLDSIFRRQSAASSSVSVRTRARPSTSTAGLAVSSTAVATTSRISTSSVATSTRATSTVATTTRATTSTIPTTTRATTTIAATSTTRASTSTLSATPSSSPVPARTQGGVALTNFNNGQLWAGFVTVGTPPVRFLIDFDTGSADFWIPSINSSSTHVKYDDKKSSTSAFVPNQQFSIQYGDGSTTSGPVFTDVVSIAGLNATKQTFSATTGNSASIERLAFDGLLGMGYQSISNLGAAPWVQNIFAQGKISAPIFSFKLAAPSVPSELFIGGLNTALIVPGSTAYFPVTYQSYWVIDGAINGGITGQNQTNSIVRFNAIIDTGTSLIIAPVADADAFYAKIAGKALHDGSGFYTFPCAQRNTVSFSYGGTAQQFPIISPGFNLGQIQAGSPTCVGAIVSSTSTLPAWIIGDIFLGNVYSTFDFTNNRVGFSKLA